MLFEGTMKTWDTITGPVKRHQPEKDDFVTYYYEDIVRSLQINE